MANKNKRYTREFSYTRPIMYQGEAYPSADSVITDEPMVSTIQRIKKTISFQ